MQPILINAIKTKRTKEFLSLKKNFDKNHSLIIFKFINNHTHHMDFDNMVKMLKGYWREISNFKRSHKEHIKDIYSFRESVHENEDCHEFIPKISMYEYMSKYTDIDEGLFLSQNDCLFNYVVIEYKKNDLSLFINFKIAKMIKSFFLKYGLAVSIYNHKDKEILDFHASYQGIYDSYLLGMKKNKKQKIESNYDMKGKRIYSIVEFIKFVDGIENDILQNLRIVEAAKIILQDERSYKYYREEYLNLSAYLKTTKISEFYEIETIELGDEVKPWDAKLTYSDREEVIEITQAVPKYEHLVRQSLALTEHGYRGLSLDLRSKNQYGIDSFPEPIIEAINKKHNKNYPERRVLIVGVLSEFAYENDDIIDSWLDYVQRKTDIGDFKSIYIIIDGKKVFKIH